VAHEKTIDSMTAKNHGKTRNFELFAQEWVANIYYKKASLSLKKRCFTSVRVAF
jgi:hypothetical protein